MSVTLDVSRVSSWLNEDAPCTESEVHWWWRCAGGVRGVWRRYRARCVLWDIVREIGAYSAVKWELGGGPNCEDAGGGTGHVCAGTHVKHPLHVRDAGGIPVGDVLVDPYL